MDSPGDETRSNRISPARLTNWALLGELGLLVLAYGIGQLTGVRFWESIQWSARGLAWGVAASVPMLAAAALLVALPWRAVDTIRRDYEMICELFRGCSVPQLLLVSLMAGLGEEALFRGALQAYAAEQATPLMGLVVASVVFGAFHALSPIYVAFATLMGAYLGAIYLWTNDLLIVILAHAVYDAAALIYGVRSRRGT